MKNRKLAGIWLDFKEAYLVVLPLEEGEEGKAPEVIHVISGIPHETAKGGSRSKAPWGPQGPTDERKILQHRLHHEKAYFEALIARMSPLNLDEIIVFGPAEAKGKFEDALLADRQHAKPKIMAVMPSEYLTIPQITAMVREYYYPHAHK